MQASPSQAGAGQSLASVLLERRSLPAAQGLALVCKLAEQVAAMHRAGSLHGAIAPQAVRLNDSHEPKLVVHDSRSISLEGADAEEWTRFFPELGGLEPPHLPTTIDDCRRQLQSAGIAFDPRAIDVCRLGMLLCQVVTGESAQGYLRSPRVKGNVPAELRPVLDRALGCAAQPRFSEAEQFLAALKSVTPNAARQDRSAELEPARVEFPTPHQSTSDTSTSFMASPMSPAITSAGHGSSRAARSGAGDDDLDAPLPFTRLGHYEIRSRLGRGGMGDVYQAYELALDRKLAIKVLPPDLAENDDFVRRFRAEATAAAKLIHPNIIQIHFIGADAGHHYFAMQFVEGESLADLLLRRGKLTVEETLVIAEQALAGLAAAHEQGMVHRDIKPGNILLDSRHRRALLADFGLVKSLESSATGKTATGVILGTVDYISPEQGRGQPVDGRSDLYSLGVLLFQMLSGRLPFVADSPTELVFQHVYEVPPELATLAPNVPAPLASIIEKLLAKSPDDRYQTAPEVLAELRVFRAGQPLPSAQSKPESARHSMIIWAPSTPDDGPLLPAGLGDLQPLKWWEHVRDRARTLFRRHAPEMVKQLQNTQQHVDGAVAEYERRERDLKQLARDAESVLDNLERQAREQREALLDAQERAESAKSSTNQAEARRAQVECQRAVEELERQASQQREQLEPIRLRLAQTNAKAQELRNQRDILIARLRAAGARVRIVAGQVQRGQWTARRKLQTTLAAIAGAVALAIVYLAIGGPSVHTTPSHRAAVPTSAPQPEHNVAEPVANLPKAEPSSVADASPTSPGPVKAASLVTPATTISPQTSKQIALSRDGTLLAVSQHFSGALDQARDEIKLWDLNTGSEILTFDEPFQVTEMAISPDLRSLIAIGSKTSSLSESEFRLWDLTSGKLRQHQHLRRRYGYEKLGGLGFSPDGKTAYRLDEVGNECELGAMDVETGQFEHISIRDPHLDRTEDRILARRLAISPVKNFAAINRGIYTNKPVADRREIQVRDLTERKIVATLREPGDTLQFSSDGRLLAGYNSSRGFLVWETVNWTMVWAHAFKGDSGFPSISISSDNRYLASRFNAKVEVFDMQEDAPSRKLSQRCLCMTFEPSGTLLVVTKDPQFIFYNLETGKDQMFRRLAPK